MAALGAVPSRVSLLFLSISLRPTTHDGRNDRHKQTKEKTMSSEGNIMISPLVTPKKNSVDPELHRTCQELGMSPPAKEGFHLALETIMHAIESDGFADELNDRKKRKALIYLYGRDYFGGKGELETRRKTEIAAMLASPDVIMARLHTVLQNTKDTDVAYLDEQFYGNWKTLVAEWAILDGSYTVFDEKVQEIVLRKQLSKKCFLHAPAVLGGYLVQHATESFQGMVDLTKFVRHYFCDESLSRLVAHDLGGDSMDVLRSLVGEAGFLIRRPRSATFVENIVSYLKLYGAALVRSFEIDDTMMAFRQPMLVSSDVIMARLHTVLQYTKDTDEQLYGNWKTLVAEWATQDEYERIPLFDNYVPGITRLHAMVLVGYRHDIGRGYNFLLQNWWPHMQFLEVTAEFLMASQAEVVFVDEPVRSFDPGHPISMHKVAETHVLEGHDCRGLGSEGA
jgi:hypothetical protein